MKDKGINKGLVTEFRHEDAKKLGKFSYRKMIRDFLTDFGVAFNDGCCVSDGFLPLNYPSGAEQALSGAGAINVTSYNTNVTTTGANALTLEDGTKIGQVKSITMVVDGGDGTLTPTNASGFATVTFNDAGDFVVLQWNGSDWIILQTGGVTVA